MTHLHTFYLILAITIMALSGLAIYRVAKRRLRIRRFFKEHALHSVQNIMQQCYQDIDGFQASKLARLHYDEPALTYGEIEIIPFAALLTLLELNEESVWVDLGSGVGKSVLLVALLYPVKEAIGVEILPSLHAFSELARSRLEDWQLQQRIHFVCQDLIQYNIEQATHIFINAAGFFGDTREKLEQHLKNAAIGTLVISVTRQLSLPHFQLTRQTRMQTSWGVSQVYIYTRLA